LDALKAQSLACEADLEQFKASVNEQKRELNDELSNLQSAIRAARHELAGVQQETEKEKLKVRQTKDEFLAILDGLSPKEKGLLKRSS
jgi:predicted  nucleic acid-binding Zn-ribbon protein